MECWVPETVDQDPSQPWEEYERALYAIFRRDFVENRPTFRGLPVSPRTNPKFGSREESFWHLTCRDYGHTSGRPENRYPDPERCSLIKWPRAFIENCGECGNVPVGKCDYPIADDCKGVMMWTSTHKDRKKKNHTRVKLFLDEMRYLVVLEDRGKYYQLVTAYPVDDEDKYRGIVREMKKKGARNAGSAV